MTKQKLRIQTDNTVQELDLAISFDSADEDEVTRMTIKTTFEGKEITAVGTHYPFEDVYADLQNKLPENVRLICCVACRYGNLCPVGNAPNEVFCTRNEIITCKSDLFSYTEDENERRKRSRHFTDCCEGFCPQEEDFYTYSDSRSYLKK